MALSEERHDTHDWKYAAILSHSSIITLPHLNIIQMNPRHKIKGSYNSAITYIKFQTIRFSMQVLSQKCL